MLGIISVTPIGTYSTAGSISMPVPDAEYPWRIDWFHRQGGLKKQWFYGSSDCPISSMTFEENLKGSGDGSITFAYIDFPIDPDDYVRIYYNGTVKYSGIVDIQPDPKSGLVTLLPLHTRYDQLLYNGSFTTQTAAQILAVVVPAMQTDSGILYNAAYIDTGSTSTITITYDYETPSKIIDDLIDALDDRFWGVDANGYFYVRAYDTSSSGDVLANDNPAYSSITHELDYSGIEATRYQVYRKTAAGETTRAGQVGFGGSYPILPIETIFRRIDKKLTVPETVASDSQALAFAYATLKAQTWSETLTVNDVILDRWEPGIGKLYRIQDEDDVILTTIIPCDTTDGWVGATLDTSDYVEGTASITATLQNQGDEIQYAFPGQHIYLNMQRLGFMIKSDTYGDFLTVKITYGASYHRYAYSSGCYSCGAYSEGDTTGDETEQTVFVNTVNIPTAGVWLYIDFAATLPVSKIEWVMNQTTSSPVVINIDRVQAVREYRTEYIDNVVQINYDIQPEGDNVTVKLNSYNTKANDNIFKLETKLNTVNGILQV